MDDPFLGFTPTHSEAPLTRRQAREREAAPAATPGRSIERPSDFPRRSAIAKSSRRSSARTSRVVARSMRASAKRPGASASSKIFSLIALLFAGTLLVGMSVPANAFMTPDGSSGGTGTAAATPGQKLTVSADAVEDGAPARDGFDVISYAEVLALKYAGIDYSYQVTTGAVRWPFPYAVPITDGFGEREGGFHKGVDFVPGGGTPIYAIADGVATTATFDNSGYGQHVVLQHNLAGVDVESLYAHMIEGSSPIKLGQQVKVGDFLGLVGDTGVAYGAHLHFEIHINKVPVDPFAWLQANAVN